MMLSEKIDFLTVMDGVLYTVSDLKVYHTLLSTGARLAVTLTDKDGNRKHVMVQGDIPVEVVDSFETKEVVVVHEVKYDEEVDGL